MRERVVPSVAEEYALVDEARSRLAAALRGWVERERRGLEGIRSRPGLADPLTPLNARREELALIHEIIDDGAGYERQRALYEETSISWQVASMGRDSVLRHNTAIFGGEIVRIVPRVAFTATGGDAEMIGG